MSRIFLAKILSTWMNKRKSKTWCKSLAFGIKSLEGHPIFCTKQIGHEGPHTSDTHKIRW